MGAGANNHEESSPLIPAAVAAPAYEKPPQAPAPEAANYYADGVPVVMGEPVSAHAFGGVPRESWNSGILSCLGRNDEFCSSDVEVCTCRAPCPRNRYSLFESCVILGVDMCVVLRFGISRRNRWLYYHEFELDIFGNG
jgi:hypothetical protein